MPTRLRYGYRALIEVAEACPHGTVSVRRIARVRQMSPKYLEQIVAALKAAGLVRAVRGNHRGYELARPPEEISLGDVAAALEGPLATAKCAIAPGDCALSEGCPACHIWVSVKDAVEGVLGSVTLKDLMARKRDNVAKERPDYSI